MLTALLLAVVSFLFSKVTAFPFQQKAFITVAYVLTESAGMYGTLILILGAGFFYAKRYQPLKAKLFSFLRSVFSMLLFLTLFAIFNEHFVKQIARTVRPSHLFMLRETKQLDKLDSVYALSKDDRRIFFNQLVHNNPENFERVDATVLKHWLAEPGGSFPSGHSFNAFLLATIFAFSLLHAEQKGLHRYYLLPFVWAFAVGLSRVIIGAHVPLDVFVGAAMGLAVSTGFLYFDTTRKWVVNKRIYRK
jgi:phosphatidylglycerophosphatase B